MIKAIIVDDEEHARETLALKLNEYCPDVQIVACLSSAADAVSAIKRYRPGLVFLDVEMPEGNGFRVLESLESPELSVVFVTAFEGHAIRALRHGAVDYLLKPVDALELQTAVARALRRRNPETAAPAMLTLNTEDGFEVIDPENIIRCRAEGAYTRLFIRESHDIFISRSLGEIEELLPQHIFYRVHNSHIVNLRMVKKYRKGRGGSVLMSDESVVEVSVRRRAEFIERIARLAVGTRGH